MFCLLALSEIIQASFKAWSRWYRRRVDGIEVEIELLKGKSKRIGVGLNTSAKLELFDGKLPLRRSTLLA